jgi:Polysaccharide lyase
VDSLGRRDVCLQTFLRSWSNTRPKRRLAIALIAIATGLAFGVGDSHSEPRSRSGAVLFDGRATRMSEIHSTSATDQTQAPLVWDCLCFLGNDIALVPDRRFGMVYSVTAGPGSKNPWWNGGDRIASAEVSKRRPVRLGQWDWYANAYKVLSGYTPADWATVTQMNYPTITSPPLEIDFDKYGVGISRAVGYVSTVGGRAEIIDHRRFFPVSAVVDKWVEFLIGVKWATDKTGAIRVYTRCRECAKGRSAPRGQRQRRGWILRYSRDNIVTMQYGAGVMNANGTSIANGAGMTTIDHAGLYFGYSSTPSTMPTNRVLQRGLLRASDMATAASSLP